MVEANIPAGEQAPVAEDNNAGPKNAPGSWETITLQERPAEIPEKFFKDGVLNVKELAKSYGELEKGKGAPAPAENKPVIPAQNAENTPAALSIPGIAAPEIAKYTAELTKDGKLSDASYDALAKVGYPKIVVDSYLRGMNADAEQAAAVEQARIADKQIAEITSAVGGDKVLTDMLAWATTNLDAKDLATYNKAVSSADVSQVRLAVNGLFHAYSQAQDPSLLSGSRKGEFSTVEPFLSNEEVVAAMQNPKYDRDPAYRAEVAERIRVSDVFQQSRDVTKESFARYQS